MDMKTNDNFDKAENGSGQGRYLLTMTISSPGRDRMPHELWRTDDPKKAGKLLAHGASCIVRGVLEEGVAGCTVSSVPGVRVEVSVTPAQGGEEERYFFEIRDTAPGKTDGPGGDVRWLLDEGFDMEGYTGSLEHDAAVLRHTPYLYWMKKTIRDNDMDMAAFMDFCACYDTRWLELMERDNYTRAVRGYIAIRAERLAAGKKAREEREGGAMHE